MSDVLSIDGGTPVRREHLPFVPASYGYEELDEVLDVIAAIRRVMGYASERVER